MSGYNHPTGYQKTVNETIEIEPLPHPSNGGNTQQQQQLPPVQQAPNSNAQQQQQQQQQPMPSMMGYPAIYQGQPMTAAGQPPMIMMHSAQQGGWVYLNQAPSQTGPAAMAGGPGAAGAGGAYVPPPLFFQQPGTAAPTPAANDQFAGKKFSVMHSVNRMRTGPVATMVICFLALAMCGAALGTTALSPESWYSYDSSDPSFYVSYWKIEKCTNGNSVSCLSFPLEKFLGKACRSRLNTAAAFNVITVIALVLTIVLCFLEIAKKELFPYAALASEVLCLILSGITFGVITQAANRGYCDLPISEFPSCSGQGRCYRQNTLGLSESFVLVVVAFSFLWFPPCFYLWRGCPCETSCCCPEEIKDDPQQSDRPEDGTEMQPQGQPGQAYDQASPVVPFGGSHGSSAAGSVNARFPGQ